jgi:hypothetical protein
LRLPSGKLVGIIPNFGQKSNGNLTVDCVGNFGVDGRFENGVEFVEQQR